MPRQVALKGRKRGQGVWHRVEGMAWGARGGNGAEAHSDVLREVDGREPLVEGLVREVPGR